MQPPSDLSETREGRTDGLVSTWQGEAQRGRKDTNRSEHLQTCSYHFLFSSGAVGATTAAAAPLPVATDNAVVRSPSEFSGTRFTDFNSSRTCKAAGATDSKGILAFSR